MTPQDRMNRLQQQGWILAEPPVGVVALGWTVKREGLFDWQVWRRHPAGISEAVGKPHWFGWAAIRQMDRARWAAVTPHPITPDTGEATR